MSRIISIIIGILIYINTIHACQCWYEDGVRSYYRYSQIKYCFSGQVIRIDTTNQDYIFTFKIQKVHKGNFKEIVKVFSPKGGGQCGIYFSLNDTFFVSPYYSKGNLYVTRCGINSKIRDYEYSLDTCFMNHRKGNYFFNYPEFKGQILNGKPFGKWEYHDFQNLNPVDTNWANIVTFNHSGKPIGESYVYIYGKLDNKTIYKNGKYHETIYYIIGTDSVYEIQYSDGTCKIFHPNGQVKFLVKNKWKNRYIKIYDIQGQLLKKIPLNKKGFVSGYIIEYNTDGSIKNKTYKENDYITDKYYYLDGND
jgi:hypothetical protein